MYRHVPEQQPDARRPGLRPGAVSNGTGRFEPHRREFWWMTAGTWRRRPADLHRDPRRGGAIMLSYNRSPDLPFDRSINSSRLREHGCIYCFARPSHAWLNLSPGLISRRG
ncbi:MAG: hypothetical protein R3D63_02560 [Paracoccaceae bacterium]